jgi:hypothetical protein
MSAVLASGLVHVSMVSPATPARNGLGQPVSDPAPGPDAQHPGWFPAGAPARSPNGRRGWLARAAGT